MRGNDGPTFRGVFLGELQADANITEEKLEELEVDSQLLRTVVAKQKQRLNLKIRQLESVEARLRVGRKLRGSKNQSWRRLPRRVESNREGHLE